MFFPSEGSLRKATSVKVAQFQLDMPPGYLTATVRWNWPKLLDLGSEYCVKLEEDKSDVFIDTQTCTLQPVPKMVNLRTQESEHLLNIITLKGLVWTYWATVRKKNQTLVQGVVTFYQPSSLESCCGQVIFVVHHFAHTWHGLITFFFITNLWFIKSSSS